MPSGVLHCVLNLEPETVAVVWNIMLPEHGVGSLPMEQDAKVCFQELIFRIRYHSALRTELFKELELSGRETYKGADLGSTDSL